MPDRGSLATGVGIGVALMYALDPQTGRRRRALVRDRLVHAGRVSADGIDAAGRDLVQRTYGTAAQFAGALFQGAPDDNVLVDRVRAKLGRVVSHPHAVKVSASQGVVTLRGPIIKAEVEQLLRAVKRVRGVRGVVNELEEHTQPADVPALHGGATRPGLRPDVLQRQWAPATRLIVGAGGTALATYGATRRDVPGMLFAASGVGLLARAVTNLDVGRLTGLRRTRRAIDIQKAITVDAPVDAVFAFWTAYENFPRFMSRVLDVRPSSREDQSHWTVQGPAGVPVTFDAEVTRIIPNQIFAWRTVEGAAVAHSGIVRFEPTRDGRTRIHIEMTYNPPGGWLGHGIAAAFGVDPKTSMDADLARMKTLIETGRPPRDAARPDPHAAHSRHVPRGRPTDR